MAITYDSGTNIITLDNDAADGHDWAHAFDMEDVLAANNAGSWGVVTKQGDNAYAVPARMLFKAGVYFVSIKEFVELKPNPINPLYTIRSEVGSHIRFGEYDTTNKYSYNGTFWQIYLEDTTGTRDSTGNRIMGEFLCYSSNVICDSTDFHRGPHFVAGATVRLYDSVCRWSGYFWAKDCNLQNIRFLGGGGTYDMLFAAGYDYSFSGVTSINCYEGIFFSDTTTAPVDIYNHKFQNCTYDMGRISAHYLIRLINSPFENYFPLASGKSFKECYEFNIKVTDNEGTPIIGATVTLKDVDGTTAFSENTIAGGVLTAAKVVVRKWFRYSSQGGIKDYNNHTLTVTKDGFETYETEIYIDHKIEEDQVVLLPYIHPPINVDQEVIS